MNKKCKEQTGVEDDIGEEDTAEITIMMKAMKKEDN